MKLEAKSRLAAATQPTPKVVSDTAKYVTMNFPPFKHNGLDWVTESKPLKGAELCKELSAVASMLEKGGWKFTTDKYLKYSMQEYKRGKCFVSLSVDDNRIQVVVFVKSDKDTGELDK